MDIIKPETEGSPSPAMDHTDGSSQRLPVTILTGFLGAGKTTCLNTYRRSPQASETAVLVNEFGEIDIDGAVLSASLADDTRLMTLPNGCVCCDVQEDLVEALVVIAARQWDAGGRIRRCIVETTGLADPGAIIRGVGHDPRLKKTTIVDEIITVCAADRLLDQLARYEEVPRQIGIADRIIITKSDLVSDDKRLTIGKTISEINPLAEIQVAINGGIEPQHLFGPRKRAAAPIVPGDLASQHHHHNSSVCTFSVRFNRPLDPARFRDVLSFLILRHADRLLRVKGIVRICGEKTPRLLNGVHDVFSSKPVADTTLDGHSAGSIVIIGEELPEDAIRADLKSCEIGELPKNEEACGT